MRSASLSKLLVSLVALSHSFVLASPEWRIDGKIRGVSLAGWLVLEPWITPSLFVQQNNSAIVDEVTFSAYADGAQGRLKDHWESFITQEDFTNIAKAGLTHVRIPMGYWAWDVSQGESYFQGQLVYLNQAVSWAKASGLKVIISLQGLPGSQNGFDGSGKKGAITWHQNKQNIDRSLNIVRAVATWYSSWTDVVVAIDAIHNPAGWAGDDFMNALKQYYYDSYGSIRYPFAGATQGGLIQIIGDAGQPLSSWKGFQTTGYDGVMMDYHYYSIWCPDCPSRSYKDHIDAACKQNSTIATSSQSLWTLVGEWSLAITDCANLQYSLMGGSSFESTANRTCANMTGDGSAFSADYKKFMRKFFEAQAMTFEANGVGWMYSTWKTENAAETSYYGGLVNQWIPWNVTERLYPNICASDDEPQIVPPTNNTAPSNSTSEDPDPDPVPQPVGPYRFRVEGRTTTLFEGSFSNPAPGRNITTPSGGTHLCDGTNNNANPSPGATLSSIMVDANITFDGTWSNSFQDFFITMIGGDGQTGNQFWGVLRDRVFTSRGGCQEQAIPNTEGLWAYDAFRSNLLFLDMTGPTVAAVNTTITVNVRATDPDNGSSTPLGGATLKDGDGNVLGTSDASGDVSVVLNKRGIWKLKAEKDGTVRSNGLTVYVLRPTNPYLNGTSNDA